MQYTNTEIDRRITDRIHNERDRQLMRRRLIDGRTYDELSAEFFLSRRQVARIIARAKSILTTEHPPDGTKRALPRHCGGALFCFIMKPEGGEQDVLQQPGNQSIPRHTIPVADPAPAAPAGSGQGERRKRRPRIQHGPAELGAAAGRNGNDRVARDHGRRRVQDRRAF